MSALAPLPVVAGVAGWPVHHSLSPRLHNYWLNELGIKGAYTMFAVHPNEATRAFLSLKRTSISGLNVTIPLKGLAYEAAEVLTQGAQKLGVCNVLYKHKGKLVGDNTDMEGFSAPLLANIGHRYLTNNTAVIFGAGGAARAVLGSLLALGVPEIRLLNRTDERANTLARNVNIPSLYAWAWQKRDQALLGAGLVINASAAGMVGKTPLDVDLSGVLPGAWVYDLVYTPLVTPLLRQANIYGLNTIGGLDMLVAQARPSFKLFFGKDAPASDAGKYALQHILQDTAQDIERAHKGRL